MKPVTLLGYALLGLLYGKPASGYDLRKIFAATPMGNYSDSPGAIYPALRGLEDRKLIAEVAKDQPALRRRRALGLTSAGMAELTRWLTSPVDTTDVATRMNVLMLRFAFMDGTLGESATLDFLQSLDRALKAHLPSLERYLDLNSSQMPASGRLALQSGIMGYKAQVQWVAHAIDVYQGKRVQL